MKIRENPDINFYLLESIDFVWRDYFNRAKFRNLFFLNAFAFEKLLEMNAWEIFYKN